LGGRRRQSFTTAVEISLRSPAITAVIASRIPRRSSDNPGLASTEPRQHSITGSRRAARRQYITTSISGTLVAARVAAHRDSTSDLAAARQPTDSQPIHLRQHRHTARGRVDRSPRRPCSRLCRLLATDSITAISTTLSRRSPAITAVIAIRSAAVLLSHAPNHRHRSSPQSSHRPKHAQSRVASRVAVCYRNSTADCAVLATGHTTDPVTDRLHTECRQRQRESSSLHLQSRHQCQPNLCT